MTVEGPKEWYFACKASQIAEDRQKMQVHVFNTEVLIINAGGAYHAMEPWCPHNATPLVHGHVKKDPESLTLVCAEHAMQIDIKTGKNLCGPYGSESGHLGQVWTYPTKVENGRIYVRLKKDSEKEEHYRNLEIPFKAQ